MEDRELLKKVKKVHFIGIGGSGMCALAEILHSRGYQITGSDNNESDTLTRIKGLGIKVSMGHDANNIKGSELVVYTAAVHEDNPELKAAREQSIPVLNRAELLGLLSLDYPDCVAIAGTHGKTTTTSMLTQILIGTNLDPTAVIGGKLPTIGGNSRVGSSSLMVCEACEFNDSFLQLHPAVSLILNIDNDHLEYFKTMENLIAHFKLFAGLSSNTVIYNGDDHNTSLAVDGLKQRKITFGLSDCNDYYAEKITVNDQGRTAFRIMTGKGKDKKVFAEVELRIPGKHNVYNALAACAAAAECGASAQEIEKGLCDFAGAGRRFEILGKVNGVTIADDYGHHPTELEATLTAAKQMNFKNVWAVFQPFTFSRTAMLMDDFARVLKIADRVVLAEIMGSREVNTYNVYSKDLAAKIQGSIWFKTFEEIADYVVKNAQPGDLVITLGCGDIYKAAKMMLKK